MKRMVWMVMMMLGVSVASGATLRLDGDRAWLHTEYRMSLGRVLSLFEARGVEVHLDPSLAGVRIVGEWDDMPLERLLKELVSPYDYVSEWRRVSGPLGSFDQLAAITVFGEGGVGAAERLQPDRKVLDVVMPKDGAPPYLRDELLLGFGPEADEQVLKALLARLGGTVMEVIDPPGLYRIKLDGSRSVEEAIELARAQEGVAAAEANYAYKREGLEPVDGLRSPTGMNLHLQPGERAVAVFDSGLDGQYAALPLIRGTYNAVNPGEAMSDPQGHGTLMAMVASGAVTPLGAEAASAGVPVLAVRTFDENGYTSSAILMDAIDYAKQSGVEVINMSWGSEVDSTFMRSIMNYASSEGLTLVSAAGNEPTGTPIYPSAYPDVLCVGGWNQYGEDWKQSNYGPFVDTKSYVYAELNGQMQAGTSIASAYVAFEIASGSVGK